MVGLIFSFQNLDVYDFCLSIFNHFNHQPVILSKCKLDLFFAQVNKPVDGIASATLGQAVR